MCQNHPSNIGCIARYPNLIFRGIFFPFNFLPLTTAGENFFATCWATICWFSRGFLEFEADNNEYAIKNCFVWALDLYQFPHLPMSRVIPLPVWRVILAKCAATLEQTWAYVVGNLGNHLGLGQE